MSDDLGRGLVNWSTDQWTALDKVASDTVTHNVVLRNLIDYPNDPRDLNAFSARIAGKNVDIKTIASEDFDFDMEQETDDDLNRKVGQAAQGLAAAEDRNVLGEMNLSVIVPAKNGYEAFSQAKGALARAGVKTGYGTVVSPDIQVILETQIAGTKSGTELVEGILSVANIAVSDALPDRRKDDKGADVEVSAVVLQAVPPVYRLVNGNSPRVRVLKVDGKKVTLRVEERIAVGDLQPNRCVGIKKV